MKEPTQEQIKVFWEGYGLEESLGFFYYKGRQVFDSSNSIDLNNLFEYAVPKLPDYVISFYPTKVNPTDNYTTWYVVAGLRDAEGVHKEDKDPALALFWALDKVRNDNTVSTGH